MAVIKTYGPVYVAKASKSIRNSNGMFLRPVMVSTLLLATCSAAWGQRFENPFEDLIQPNGHQLTYTGVYAYPGYEKKRSGVDVWKQVSDNEYRRTYYILDDGEWEAGSAYTMIDGKYARSLYYYPNGYIGYHLTEESPEPPVVILGQPYSGKQIESVRSLKYDMWMATYEYSYTVKLEAIEIIDLPFGKVCAYQFQEEYEATITYTADFGGGAETYEGKYTYWHTPGLGTVQSDASDPLNDLVDTYELTEINFEFDPEPLPILDSDNAVWNMLGYTWESGGGWQYSFEFGSVFTSEWPTVFLDDSQAWLYLQGDRHSLWIWDYARARWVWTTQALWPWYFDNLTTSWQYGL